MISELGQSYLISKDQIDRFAKALAQAVYDSRVEQSQGVKIFYDAEVAVWMAIGFQQLDSYNKHPSERLLLVRALQSAGYLGTVNLLRPHALELDVLIRRQPALSPSGVNQGFSKRVSQFLHSEGIDRHIQNLADILQKATTKDEQIEIFLHELQTVGAETFASIELANGNWQQRLNRIHDRLSFDQSGGDLEELLKDERVWVFDRMIAGERLAKGLTLSNLRDALALVILQRLIPEARHGGPQVRFHTEAGTLIRAWTKHKDLKAALSYLPGEEGLAWEENFIFRNLDYFVVRASFGALTFRELERRPELGAAVSLSELQEVSMQLTEALRDTDSEGFRRIESIKIDGRPLPEVIWEVESLSFIRDVFSQYKPPEPLKRMISGLREVWGFASDGAIKERVESEIRREVSKLSDELAEKVADFRDWLNTFREIQKRADKLRKRLREHEIPDPMRDLGLIRWVSDVNENTSRTIQEALEGLISPDEETWSRGCAGFTSIVENIANADSCLAVCAILWALSLFDKAVEVINRFEDRNGGELPPGLIVMRSAARLRGRSAFSRTEKQRHIEALLNLRSRVEEQTRGRLLLGVAYVTYYAWYIERHHESLGGTQDDPAQWVSLSFDLGEEAFDFLKDDRLGRAFAVNHCAYVGSVAGIRQDRTEYYLHRLAEIRGEEDLWHYRFADTIAYSNYLAASHLWRTLSEDLTLEEKAKDEGKARACRMLRQAEDHLNEARPYFGDPEIPQHRLEIESLTRKLSC